MALRDKLVTRTQEHLEPGEQVRQVFLAQTGPSPLWIILTYLTLFWNKYFIVAVTDRNIVTFRASVWRPSFIKQPPQMVRLDRNQMLGPISGLWGKTMLGDEKVHVHKRFHKDIAAADEERARLTGAATPIDPAGVNPATAGPEAAANQSSPAAIGNVEATPAGWYPDPHGQASQRYYDGRDWTDQTA